MCWITASDHNWAAYVISSEPIDGVCDTSGRCESEDQCVSRVAHGVNMVWEVTVSRRCVDQMMLQGSEDDADAKLKFRAEFTFSACHLVTHACRCIDVCLLSSVPVFISSYFPRLLWAELSLLASPPVFYTQYDELRLTLTSGNQLGSTSASF